MNAPYLFPYLIDSPEDGYVEERGWLAGELATTPTKAAKVMRRLYVADHGREAIRYDERMTFGCAGSEWHRPTVLELSDEGEEIIRPPVPDDDPEDIRFNKCQPDDDGAQEWWVCELVPVRWPWRFWPFDLFRAVIRAYRYRWFIPRIHTLADDDPRRDRLIRRNRRLSRWESRLP